jgi:hypothetical protein
MNHFQKRMAEIKEAQMGRSHIILPIFTRPPAPPPETPSERYARALIAVLDRRIQETGELDEAIADRIEGFLWPQLRQAS